MKFSLCLTACLLMIGCGAGTTQVARPTGNPLVPSRLYPLADGHIWSYDVDTGTGMNTLAIARASRRRDGLYEVHTGSEPNVYEVLPEGIRRLNGSWLLRTPIEAHASWDLGGGRRAEITSVDASVETPAGSFAHCVEVAERGGEGAQIRTVYCPDVGPVFIESSMQMLVARQNLQVVARLRGHTDGTDM